LRPEDKVSVLVLSHRKKALFLGPWHLW